MGLREQKTKTVEITVGKRKMAQEAERISHHPSSKDAQEAANWERPHKDHKSPCPGKGPTLNRNSWEMIQNGAGQESWR